MATKIEADVARLTEGLDTLVRTTERYFEQSKEERDRDRADHREEMDKLWAAQTQQGERMTSAIQTMSEKNRITWPAIFAAITVFLGILGAGAKVLHAFVEKSVNTAERIDALRDDYSRRDHERIEQEVIRLASGKPLP